MNIAIAGYGMEGKSNYTYWNTPDNTLTIVDERETLEDLPEGAATILGSGAFEKLDGFDLVIRTAGLAPYKLQTDGKIWSSTREFFTKCPAPIIGITGTKGKGTTASLIASIFKAAGRKVHLVGNIGVSALSQLQSIQSDDIVVFELSSYQLWDLDVSPAIAVVLLIEPDHLNVHEGMDDYVSAKANIAKYQGPDDIIIYHPTNHYAMEIAELSAGRKLPYGIHQPESVFVEMGSFQQDEHIICSVSELQLIGQHNVENACAAITVARHYSIENDAIASGLRNFKGLPHRLQFVGEVNGVKFYDDSIATTPGSAIAALKSFDQPKVLILGGQSKGVGYSEIIEKCQQTSTKVIAIGETGDEIARLCVEHQVDCQQEQGDMSAIVARAYQEATPGGVVILSPATASFDMFKSYSERGDKFISAVNSL